MLYGLLFVSFDYEEIKKYNSGFRVIRAVKVFSNSGIGITKGVPFVHLWINHSHATLDTYGGYFVDLYHGNHINNLNFTNVCLALDGGDDGSGEDGENVTSTVFTTLFPFTSTTSSMTTTSVVANATTTTTSNTTTTTNVSSTVATTTIPENRTEAALEESFDYMILVYTLVPVVFVILLVLLGLYLKNKNNKKNRTGNSRRSIESQSGSEFNREAATRGPGMIMYKNPTYVPAGMQSFNNFTNDRRFLFEPSNDPNNEPIYANSHI